MKGKIIATFIALGMVAMGFAMLATPVAAADAQLVWQYCGDETAGVNTAEYYNSAGTEGWTVYWAGQETSRPIYRGDPADSNQYVYSGPGELTAVATVMDVLYPGAGWLYFSDYACIMEDASGYGAVNIETTDNAGTYTAIQMPLVELPIATAVDADPDITVSWAAMPTNGLATISTYNVYRSTSNVDWDDTGAGGPAFWTLEGAAVTSPWTDTNIMTGSGNTYYYSIQPIVDGTEADVPFMYGSKPSNGIDDSGGTPNVPPVVDTASTVPATHNGNTVTEYVTLTATASDADSGPGALTLEYSLDGGVWTGFTSPVDINFPTPYTEGPHTVEVRAYDTANYSVVVNADFTITDTTPPVADWNGVPGATAYVNQDLIFNVDYLDFTDWETAVADSFFTYDLNTVNQGNFAWTEVGSYVGSQGYYLQYTILAGTFSAGDTIDYGGQVTGTEATPLTTVLGAGGPILMEDPPVLSDPYPVYGAVELYNGDGAGTYTPIAAPDGTPVDVMFYNTTGVFVTESTTTVGGLYTVDCDGYDGTNVFGIEIAAGPFPGYNNMGYGYIDQATAVASPGGSLANVTCGIPVNVTITAPGDGSSVTAGIAFNVDYEFVDIDGVRAQGYYTHADGQMDWWSNDPLFVTPGPFLFDGVTTTQGAQTDSLTLFTAPSAWINITEGGAAEANPYLTPWGAISTQIGGVATDMWIEDWSNITLNILSGGFEWRLVANGWNLVSAPMDPVLKGAIPVFDAADGLAACQAAIVAAFGAPDPSLQMADRIGPGTYDMVTLATPEAAAFAIDGVHGYWIYAETTIDVYHSALNYSAGSNVLNAAAGWTIAGFTHNEIAWTTVPMASHFTDGTFGPSIGVTNTKIDVTMWDYNLQHYYSYVVDGWFVMPGRDWAWDFWSAIPGNGFFLYLDAAAVVTFDVAY